MKHMGDTMSTPPADGLYKTADLYYAAYLKVAAVPFLGDEQSGNRAMFVFEKPDNLRELKAQFFNRTAKVSALSYADEIKALKAVAHMERSD